MSCWCSCQAANAALHFAPFAAIQGMGKKQPTYPSMLTSNHGVPLSWSPSVCVLCVLALTPPFTPLQQLLVQAQILTAKSGSGVLLTSRLAVATCTVTLMWPVLPWRAPCRSSWLCLHPTTAKSAWCCARCCSGLHQTTHSSSCTGDPQGGMWLVLACATGTGTAASVGVLSRRCQLLYAAAVGVATQLLQCTSCWIA